MHYRFQRPRGFAVSSEPHCTGYYKEPLLRIKIMLESNLLKSIMLVRRLAVGLWRNAMTSRRRKTRRPAPGAAA